MILRTRIPFYSGNIKESKPKGSIEIGQFLHQIKHPNAAQIELIHKIRTAPDEKTKGALKTQLMSVTPATFTYTRRDYASINYFTGIMPLDFDKLESRAYAEEFKNAIFNEYPFIFAAWLSSSGKGCRFLVSIPEVRKVEEYKDYFEG